MAQKRFGPIRGAGVSVTELEGEKGIEPGALGFAGYGGVFEKGPVGEMVRVTGKASYLKKFGAWIDDSLAPDCAIDFFDNAAGAGGLLIVRVTDGNEVAAQATLYGRYGDLLTPVGTCKAKNGGRWGGAEKRYTADMSAIGDLTDITLDTGLTLKEDQWKGGYIELDDVANSRYPIVGNTVAGIVSVSPDQTMLQDHSGGVNLRYYLVLENEGKEVSILIEDGEENAATEFALSTYVDGAFIKKYPNLSTDPTSSRYWVDIINEDGANDEIEVVDLWTGAHVPAVRPANHYGVIDTVTDTVLTAVIHDVTVNSPVGLGDPTFALDTTNDDMIAQKITLTFSDPNTFTAVSDKFGALGAGTMPANPAPAVPFVPNNKWTPEFSITDGVTPLVAADTVVINYKPLVPDQLIGGKVYPDKANEAKVKFRIVDNDHKTITAADGSTMTDDGAPLDEWLVEAPRPLAGGFDGHAGLVDADYNQQLWDVDLSPFNRTENKNLGLVKFATPGVTSTAVSKAGVAYAAAKNHQYRYEIPSNKTTENGAEDHINNTLGRSDYACVYFPSYGYVPDPEATEPGKLKLVPLTGQIHGKEARISNDYVGYHKAQAGIEVTLPKVLKIPTGDNILDEEVLNPLGIGVIKKVKGNFILWGDRTLWLDPAWKWKHQREQMSYYEHVLQEGFDWIVFMINDPVTEKLAFTALRSFFQPEFVKRAIRGDSLDDAAKIKIDAENNTDATRAAGDMFAEIKLRLADTVERFNIIIGKQGIFDSVG
jgi:hypothetical protein